MSRWRQYVDDFTGRDAPTCGAPNENKTLRCDALRDDCNGVIHRNSSAGRQWLDQRNGDDGRGRKSR